jgi:hypothetical protein
MISKLTCPDTVGQFARSSHAEACVIMSAMSSCAALIIAASRTLP